MKNANRVDSDIELTRHHDAWRGSFQLMASTCEVHLRVSDEVQARTLIAKCWRETKRIQDKFSRYQPDSALSVINRTAGTSRQVDDEIIALLNYADALHKLSGGLFDISSGVLRHLWPFGSDRLRHQTSNIPDEGDIQAALKKVGWSKVQWQAPELLLPQGMELDFGGIGKEYAVDRVAQTIAAEFDGEFLVNFGGDCFCLGSKQAPWHIAIESTKKSGEACSTYSLISGGIATSGTTKRFIELNGKRYGHILNPKLGMPIEGAPLSVTVAGDSCMAAGAISTLAMLQGKNAEAFLNEQGVDSHIIR